MGPSNRDIIRGSLWSYIGQISILAVALLSNILLARLLDKDNWGAFSALIAVVSFISGIADLGLSYSILHKAASNSKERPDAVKKAISTPLYYKMLIIVLIGALMFVFSNQLADIFHLQNGGAYFVLAAVFFVVLNIFSTFDIILSGLKLFKESSAVSFLHYMLRLVLSVVLIIFGFQINGAMLGYIVAVALATAFQVFVLRKYLSIKKEKGENITEMFSYGFYFGLGNIAATFALWTDSILIGAMIGTTAVGVYRIALSIVTATGGLGGVISKVMFPFFTSIEAEGKDPVGRLNTAIKYSSFFAFPMMVGMMLSAGGIVTVFFGNQYTDSILPLIILSYICFDMVFTTLVASYLGAKKDTKIIGYTSAASAILNAILNYFMIPLFGLIGAASISVITRIGNVAAMILFSKTGLKEKINLRVMGVPLIGSLLMGAVLLVLIPYISPSSSLLRLLLFVASGMASYTIFEQLLGFDVVGFGNKVINALK